MPKLEYHPKIYRNWNVIIEISNLCKSLVKSSFTGFIEMLLWTIICEDLFVRQPDVNVAIRLSGWWFGTCFIFPYIGNNNPN